MTHVRHTLLAFTFEFKQNLMPVEEKVLETFQGKDGKEFWRKEIVELVIKKFPDTNKSSIMPSDYCYNITNNGIKFNFHVFKWLSRGKYKYLGQHLKYSGKVYWKGLEYGVWVNGVFRKI